MYVISGDFSSILFSILKPMFLSENVNKVILWLREDRGVAAPRVLELKNGSLKPKIEKRALQHLFNVFLQTFEKKKSQLLVQLD